MNSPLKSYAVLLAGGTGTRLWPVSREHFPKQLVNFIGKDSLVQSTLKRLSPAIDPQRVRIVSGEEHYNEIRRHVTEIGISADGKILTEPCGRNTAPAILLAVLNILKTDGDAVICVFPADHVIKDIEAFHEKIAGAVNLAGMGHIVTFGITPHYPETGYGYIEGAGVIEEGALVIQRFVEKPDIRTAEQYVAAGNFFWNSGIFAFKASVIVDEYRKLAPEVYDKMESMVLENGSVLLSDYETLPNISIDYAIMENTHKGVVLPSNFGWSDIGSWKSLYDFLPKDTRENVIDGDVIAMNTEGCFILGRERLIATNHLRNIVVVETPDSVFVSDLDNSRDVKDTVARLKALDRQEYKTHRTVYHPWGIRTLMGRETGALVERVTVYAGETLPFAGDKGSEAHMTVIQGSGVLGKGEEDQSLLRGETYRLGGGESATIKNKGAESLVFIQVTVE